jgi:hypothetical protein
VALVWWRRRARARLADDIAEYADRVRAEALRDASRTDDDAAVNAGRREVVR